jgi:hypothetical protein
MRTDLLVNDFTYKAITDKYIVVFEKLFKRNFIHIEDVASAFLFMLENYDKYKGEVFVKIEENDFSVKYMIAKSSNVVNSKSLQLRLTEKIQGLRNIKAINVTDATATQYIDYGLYSQPFMMSYLPDISGDLNIPRIKSREQRLSTIDAVYRPVETVDKVKIIDILTQQRKPGTSTFIKTLYDLSNKYNVSVLDIIKNTGDVGNTTLYNELVQKSNSTKLEVDFHYFDDVLTISESSVQDKEGEENGNELPQTMFDVIRKLNETIGSNLDNLLLNLKDEYAGKLIYATPGAGKTFIASMSKNVIDFDNLLAQHITKIDSTAVRKPGQTIQNFIFSNQFVRTIISKKQYRTDNCNKYSKT